MDKVFSKLARLFTLVGDDKDTKELKDGIREITKLLLTLSEKDLKIEKMTQLADEMFRSLEEMTKERKMFQEKLQELDKKLVEIKDGNPEKIKEHLEQIQESIKDVKQNMRPPTINLFAQGGAGGSVQMQQNQTTVGGGEGGSVSTEQTAPEAENISKQSLEARMQVWKGIINTARKNDTETGKGDRLYDVFSLLLNQNAEKNPAVETALPNQKRGMKDVVIKAKKNELDASPNVKSDSDPVNEKETNVNEQSRDAKGFFKKSVKKLKSQQEKNMGDMCETLDDVNDEPTPVDSPKEGKSPKEAKSKQEVQTSAGVEAADTAEEVAIAASAEKENSLKSQLEVNADAKGFFKKSVKRIKSKQEKNIDDVPEPIDDVNDELTPADSPKVGKSPKVKSEQEVDTSAGVEAVDTAEEMAIAASAEKENSLKSQLEGNADLLVAIDDEGSAGAQGDNTRPSTWLRSLSLKTLAKKKASKTDDNLVGVDSFEVSERAIEVNDNESSDAIADTASKLEVVGHIEKEDVDHSNGEKNVTETDCPDSIAAELDTANDEKCSDKLSKSEKLPSGPKGSNKKKWKMTFSKAKASKSIPRNEGDGDQKSQKGQEVVASKSQSVEDELKGDRADIAECDESNPATKQASAGKDNTVIKNIETERPRYEKDEDTGDDEEKDGKENPELALKENNKSNDGETTDSVYDEESND